MGNRKKGLWILIAITVILLMINPRTIKYLKAKTSLDRGEIYIIKEIETPHSSQIIYEKFGDGLIKYWEGVLIYYNTVGEQIWSMNLAINKPVIRTNSDSIYIIDENKNQILCINKKGEQIYKSTLDKSYKNFDVCDSNYVVLYHETEDPVQYITIINKEGKKISEIVLGEGEITNLAISGIHDRIAMSTININGDSLENSILVYDLKANLLSSENFNDDIILNMFYNERGDLIVIDEGNICSKDKNNLSNWQVNLDNPVTIMNTKNKNFMLMYSEDRGKKNIIYSPTGNTIKTLTYDGKLLSEIKQDEEIVGMDSYKSSIIAYSTRTIFKYDKNGNLKMEYPYTGDILKCFGLSDDNIAVITKEKISFLSFKK